MTVYREVAEVGADDKLLEIRYDRDNLRNNPVRGEYMNDRVGNAGFCDRGITVEPAHVGNPPKTAPIWRIIFCLSITAAAAATFRGMNFIKRVRKLGSRAVNPVEISGARKQKKKKKKRFNLGTQQSAMGARPPENGSMRALFIGLTLGAQTRLVFSQLTTLERAPVEAATPPPNYPWNKPPSATGKITKALVRNLSDVRTPGCDAPNPTSFREVVRVNPPSLYIPGPHHEEEGVDIESIEELLNKTADVPVPLKQTGGEDPHHAPSRLRSPESDRQNARSTGTGRTDGRSRFIRHLALIQPARCIRPHAIYPGTFALHVRASISGQCGQTTLLAPEIEPEPTWAKRESGDESASSIIIPPGGRVLPPSIAPFVSKKPVPRTESAAYRTHWSTCVPQDPPPAEVRFLHVAGDHVVHLLPALAVTWPILDISGSAPTPVGVFLFFYDTLLTYTLAAIFLKG
ncbi:hypothetical protein GEV33_004809 [Tenebrio molitor]|uniref:Uncharacterized protein n=1 Tax=Tenebrio molitor TaxID=7067 RepID=A0A8J6HMK9_TENMO|nr:hypothetical protein GEV33_004809 [Tenebrio molitor]